MKIYQTSFDYQQHRGYRYYSSRKAAANGINEAKEYFETDSGEAEIRELEIKLTKKDVLRFLNKYASHNDNG